jgi:hypothetical protein
MFSNSFCIHIGRTESYDCIMTDEIDNDIERKHESLRNELHEWETYLSNHRSTSKYVMKWYDLY